jgi:hypothetical protein
MPQAYRLVVECTQYTNDSDSRLDASFHKGSQDEKTEVLSLLGTLSRIIKLLGEPRQHGNATTVGRSNAGCGRSE